MTSLRVSGQRPSIHLVAMVNPPTSQYSENWRNPLGRQDWLHGNFFADLGRTLERGLFDMIFLADALAVPQAADGSVDTTLATGGKGSIYLDPIAIIALVASVTTHLGVGATLSTTFVPPYTLARQILTVDQLSRGRAAWNVVTSTTDAEAANFGLDAIPDRDARYEHADAVVEAVLRLWDSWEPDALVLDREARRFADPARVRRASAAGEGPRGPLTVPASPQGRPVLMQAGSSSRGLDFAARWAETVFAIAASADEMREQRAEIRARAQRDHGRDPDSIVVLPAIQPISGWTSADAESKRAQLRAQLDTADVLRKLGRLLHVPDGQLDPAGDAVTLLESHRGATGSSGFEEMMISAAGRSRMTVLDLAVEQAMNQLHPEPVGDPSEIADELEELFLSGAADGFVVMPALYHASFEEFVNGVVPELQRRGLYRTAYTGSTLREHLFGPAALVQR